jgi:hypothetical protein
MTRNDRKNWTFVLCDSLEKVFADERPREMDETIPYSVFLGETASFQVAFLPPTLDSIHTEIGGLEFAVTRGSDFTAVSSVELVGCPLVAFDNADAGWLRTAPGLYPDLLVPNGAARPIVGQWRAMWVDFNVANIADAGTHTVTVQVKSTASGDVLFEKDVTIVVLPRELPKLDIVNTHWFHSDGLAEFYHVEVFSEAHWQIIDNFIAKAAEADINSLLTPTWTPPLDTAVGGFRMPTQLIDISWRGDRYSFGFDKLIRWIEICTRHGIRYLEVAHLFTQWGAQSTPAIYVERDGAVVREFGWETQATDPRYRNLLEQLLPEMMQVFRDHWDVARVIYHISDEPRVSMLDSYTRAKAVVSDLLEGCVIVDALSDYEFYESGAVAIPVIATDHVAPFIANQVEPFWVYYCVAQNHEVANRFIGQPSLRNRVLGWQLFAFDVDGFLQWGYNFYNNRGSTRSINPFADTSAGGQFLAGDSFLVYPGPDGCPYESIRFRVFATAMADHRAMSLAAELVGKLKVMEVIDPDGTLAFDHFSYDPDHYRRAREAINVLIIEA